MPAHTAHVRRTHSQPATLTDSERDSVSDEHDGHVRTHEHDAYAGPDDGGQAHEPWLVRLLSRASAFADVISQHRHTPCPLLARHTADDAAPTRMARPTPWAYWAATSHAWPSIPAHALRLSTRARPRARPPDPESSPRPPTPPLDDAHSVSSPAADVAPHPALTADQKMALIIEEFGRIPGRGGGEQDGTGEERLIAETDATLVQDVSILGVLHLTTHRIAFHASLLPFDDTEALHADPGLSVSVSASASSITSPTADLAAPHPHHRQPAFLSRARLEARWDRHRVLHAGTAVVGGNAGMTGGGRGWGFSGWGRGRSRVWIELTPDMVSSFRSSGDHDRVRPLMTLQLSSFRKIHPFDPLHPRRITVELEAEDAGETSWARGVSWSRRAAAPGTV
ncbi:hypothetical protein JB92DRAFT_1757658 [Gautieria morchelliformis]|nr:hypothetical protein JB92DRAFT_1757658 [Gautieria morchelliformis]